LKHENFEDKINQNCLEGMRCPNCLSAGPFNIVCETWVEMHDDGSEKHEDLDYDDDSHARCLVYPCEWHGTVGQMRLAFRVIERVKEDILSGMPIVTKATYETFARDVQRDFTLVADDFARIIAKKNPILLEAIQSVADISHSAVEEKPDEIDIRSISLISAFFAIKLLYSQDEVDQLEAAREA
jgi:hypothetical protein